LCVQPQFDVGNTKQCSGLSCFKNAACKIVLIQVVPLLVMFLTKFLSFRKVLRKVFLLFMVNTSNQQGTRENAGIYR